MTLVNNADAFRLGSSVVNKLYLGATQVWPAAAPAGWVGDLAGFNTDYSLLVAYPCNGDRTELNGNVVWNTQGSFAASPVSGYSGQGLATASGDFTNTLWDNRVTTDAGHMLYVPADLSTGHYGLFHNGGGTNAQCGAIRSLNNGETIEVGITHNDAGSLHDETSFVLPEAMKGTWIVVSYQYITEDGDGDSTPNGSNLAIWVDGVMRSSVPRVHELDYGSGNPRLGGSGGDPYFGWGNDGDISSSNGLLIANFWAANPTGSNSTTTTGAVVGLGDAAHLSFYNRMTAGTA